LLWLNSNEKDAGLGRTFKVVRDQAHRHSVRARPVRNRLVVLEKRDGAGRGFHINAINQQDCVGVLICNLAQMVLGNILSINDVHSWRAANPLGHAASSGIVAPAAIADAHHDYFALQLPAEFFS
jgi:hypothetical protein